MEDHEAAGRPRRAGAPGQQATAVAASSAANAWVFGLAAGRVTDYTMAEHWTGKGWARPVAFQAWARIAAVLAGQGSGQAQGVILKYGL
jgi:hypothetical protein